MTYKILAKVRFNSDIAIVLDKCPALKYFKKGSIIYGTDGLFYSCYYYDRPTPRFKAFAGRKFDIHLENGETIHCTGQWWDGGYDKVGEIVGAKICSVAIATISELKSCYVFTGYQAAQKKWTEFVDSYNLPIYGYWDYQKIIKYSDMVKSYLDQIFKLEKAKDNLIKVVKEKHKQIVGRINDLP